MARPVQPYEMYVLKNPGMLYKGSQWKVTARYTVHTERGSIACIRLHCFGGKTDHTVLHLDLATLKKNFKKATPRGSAS